MEGTIREAALQERRRQELDLLKQQRKERAKLGGASGFSGKQKKQQLRARKQRLATRKDEAAKVDAAVNEDKYGQFYEDKQDLEDQVFDEGDQSMQSFREEPDFYARNADLADDIGSRLKLTVALGKNNKDAVGKELSSFFVKETKEQIQLRLMEGQKPLAMAKRLTPLLAGEIPRDPIMDHPRRPKWNYTMTKQKVDDNESIMFDRWLTKIHEKYPNEKLNHFEHNLEVWRELWRVTERATHIVIVTDIRNPLLHIPPSVYDLVTNEMKKPIRIVLNKVDLVPRFVVDLWKVYLTKRFPKAQFICFSSRSTAVYGDTDVSARRRVLSKKLEVGDASAIKGAVQILQSCGVDASEAEQIAQELNAGLSEFNDQQEQKQETKGGKRRAKAKKKAVSKSNDGGPTTLTCQHCGGDDAIIACMSCALGGIPSSKDAIVKDEADAIARGYLLCERCDLEEHLELKGHHSIRLKSAAADKLANPAEAQNPTSVKVTIGLIGHPNVGKSSVLNALAGKKIVSVSHTPGHTKRLQSILITPEICICDCPGLVFPIAELPKHIQELCGLYPYSQIREPYSAVRFLAEHTVMEKVLDLKPRTQEFDGIEEEIEWTPWTICEAYAEKRGYRTDRRGRPDHQRAGSELVRDTVDGILPLFFLPPDYKGKNLTPENIQQYLQRQKAAADSAENEESGEEEQVDSDEDLTEDGEIHSEDEKPSNKKAAKGHQQAAVNAFSLLDSDSSDEENSDDE